MADVDTAVLEAFLPRRDAERATDEIGVRELLTSAEVPVVEEDVEAGGVESRSRLQGDLLGARQRDDVRVVGCDLGRPGDALLVVVLLDDRGDHATRPDSVATHDQQLLRSVLVEKRRPERGGIARAQLEDVAELDRRLDDQAPAAVRAAVVLLRRANVGELGLVVPSRLDASKVPAVAIRTGDELPRAQ